MALPAGEPPTKWGVTDANFIIQAVVVGRSQDTLTPDLFADASQVQ